MAFVGSVTGSVNLGGAATFISSSNGSSVEIGASTQVLILSGGSSAYKDPRNLPDVNFFVSGAVASAQSATRGTSLFGGDVVVSGVLQFGGDLSFPNAINRLSAGGQYAYWQNWYPTNPVTNLAAKFGAPLFMFQLIATDVGISGKVRLGANGTGTGTARLHITASSGAASTAPIKIDSGTLLATPEAGTIEYDATRLYLTDGGSSRRNILMTGDVTGTFNDSLSRLATTASVSFAGSRGAAYFASSSVGGDVFFFVSGTSGLKDQINSGKVSVFGGDVVVSGTIFGGASFGTSTSLTLRSSKVQVTANALGFGQSGGNDVSFFVSGSTGSRGGATPGSALFGGDVILSGGFYVAPNTGTIGSDVTFWVSGTQGIAPNIAGRRVAVFSGDVVLSGGAGIGNRVSIDPSIVFARDRGQDNFVWISGTIGVTDTTARKVVLGGDLTVSGGVAVGPATAAIASDVYFFASGTARQGHNPGIGLTARRALFNGDIVTSGTLQLVGAGNTLTIGSDTLMFVSGSPGSKGITFSRGTSVFAGDLVVSGATHIGTTVETVGLTSSIGAGVNRFDVTQQTIFYLSGTTADFTANFINVPSGSAARAISVTLLVTQSSTACKPTAVQIDGGFQTLLWANGVTPTANANKQDVFGFSLVRSGTVWAVLGQMSTYG